MPGSMPRRWPRLTRHLAAKFDLDADVASGLRRSVEIGRPLLQLVWAGAGMAVFFGWVAGLGKGLDLLGDPQDRLWELVGSTLALFIMLAAGYGAGVALGVAAACAARRVFLEREFRRVLAGGPHVCLHCFHSLTGLPPHEDHWTCPECGERTRVY